MKHFHSFNLLSTKPVDFLQLIATTDKIPEALIKELNEKRSQVFEALQTKNHPGLIKALEEYSPKIIELRSIGISSNFVHYNLEFIWKSCLGKDSKKKYMFSNLEEEISFILTTLALQKMNHAFSLIENQATVDEKDFNAAANELCQASGIFEYAALEVVSNIINLPFERPPEILKGTLLGLHNLALAEAGRVVVLKAIQKGKMSLSLLAKLLVGLADKYVAAEKSLRTMVNDYDDLDHSLKVYVEWMANCYSPAMYLKYLALDAFQTNHFGDALGFIRKGLSKLKKISKSDNETAHDLYTQEFQGMKELEQKSERSNNMITFEAIPTDAQIETRIPEPKFLLQLIPYSMALPQLPSASQVSP